MLAVISTYEPIGQLITPDEYDALPENPRRELVDGVVHVMATPTPLHQEVVDGLVISLRASAPAELRVTREIEIRLGDTQRRNPDVLVVWVEGFNRTVPRLQPEQVLLAVEVVSPGSETDDRHVKPTQYAEAGIEHYWRVEVQPSIVVNTFRLGDNATYVQTGVFTPGDTVTAPGLVWAGVRVADLLEEF